MASTRIVVMSDSHGDREIVKNIKERYLGKVDAIFHNGDSELSSSDPIWEGIHVVAGNCDYDSGYPNILVVHLPNATIAQTHGHLYHINFMWDRLDLFAQEAQADICLYGHLHRAAAWKEGNIVFVNPGSVLQPRGEINDKLYALVEITTDSIKVDYYTRDHKLFPAISKDFSR